MARLADGPWCGTAPFRFDADLFRVRRVRVRLRLEADTDVVRSRTPARGARAGWATAPARVVRDVEIAIDVAPPAAAAQAGLEIAAGALAREPDIAAVRLGLAVGPGGADRLVTPDGTIDVATRTRQLEQRRRRQPPPADVAVWRPYLWGRLGELASAIPAVGGRDPLVVVWVRGDEGAGAGADRLELAVEAVGPSGARAGAVAAIRRGPRGVAILAAWPDAGIAGPG